MKNRKRTARGVHRCIVPDPKKAAEMFSEDGAFEMPYLESVGVPGRYEGREASRGSSASFAKSISDMDLENVKIMIDTPEQVFAEYEFTAQSSKTGRTTTNSSSGVWSQRTARSSFFAIGQPGWVSRRFPQGSPTTRLHRNTRHKTGRSHRLDPGLFILTRRCSTRKPPRTGAWSTSIVPAARCSPAPTTSADAIAALPPSPAANPESPTQKRGTSSIGLGLQPRARTHQCRRRGARRRMPCITRQASAVATCQLRSRRFF